VREINKSIDNEFIGLRNNLFEKVISNKKIVVNILKNVHITSAFLNKFYTLFRDLAEEDVIPKEDFDEYLKDKKYEKCINLIVDSGLAEFTPGGELKASSLFKKMMENNKGLQPAIEEAVSKVVTDNYEYITQELGLGHIKPYINVISCVYYVNNFMKLKELNIRELYKIHEHLYGTLSFISFKEKINSLVTSDVLIRKDDNIRLILN